MTGAGNLKKSGSAWRHAQGAVQANDFAVQVPVGHDVAGQLGEFFGLAQARGEGDAGGQRRQGPSADAQPTWCMNWRRVCIIMCLLWMERSLLL